MSQQSNTSLSDKPAAASATPNLPIGEALRFLRNRLGLKQIEAGQLGGPDFRTISHWETGRKQPSLRLLVQYLNALEVDLSDLQEALDRLVEQPPATLPERLTRIERRVAALERWRFGQTGAAIERIIKRHARGRKTGR